MKQQRFSGQFETVYTLAVLLARSVEASALVVLLDGAADWDRMKELCDDVKLIVVADSEELLKGAAAEGLSPLVVDLTEMPIPDQLGNVLIRCVADGLLVSGAKAVAVYSGLEADKIDTISVVDMGEHLGRLTVRDLQQLETRVPLDTLQTVVNLALDIGREGREGKPVGTLFVIGDTRKVLAHSHPTGFDPVKGYSRKERNLKSARVREGIKEIAQMDGAIIVAPDGTVAAAARYLDAPAANVRLAKGLGARHWAGAAISRLTKAVAVVVSQSSGTVRLFQNGEVILRIEPFRRAMKWRDFEREPPQAID
jgi:DNA integrity scanning protein DisA with diadenylate cyclase activity